MVATEVFAPAPSDPQTTTWEFPDYGALDGAESVEENMKNFMNDGRLADQPKATDPGLDWHQAIPRGGPLKSVCAAPDPPQGETLNKLFEAQPGLDSCIPPTQGCINSSVLLATGPPATEGEGPGAGPQWAGTKNDQVPAWLRSRFQAMCFWMFKEFTWAAVWLCHIIGELLEDTNFNPGHSGVPLRKVADALECATKEFQAEDVLNAALNGQTLEEFVAHRSDVFATSQSSGETQLHLLWHPKPDHRQPSEVAAAKKDDVADAGLPITHRPPENLLPVGTRDTDDQMLVVDIMEAIFSSNKESNSHHLAGIDDASMEFPMEFFKSVMDDAAIGDFGLPAADTAAAGQQTASAVGTAEEGPEAGPAALSLVTDPNLSIWGWTALRSNSGASQTSGGEVPLLGPNGWHRLEQKPPTQDPSINPNGASAPALPAAVAPAPAEPGGEGQRPEEWAPAPGQDLQKVFAVDGGSWRMAEPMADPARQQSDGKGPRKPHAQKMEQLAKVFAPSVRADQVLCEAIVALLEDHDFNPGHGSVMIEKLRSMLVKDDKQKHLVQRVLGDRTFADFIGSQKELFCVISLPNRRSRMYYREHKDWRAADTSRLVDQQKHQQAIREALQHYLAERGPYFYCTVEEFLEVYSTSQCDVNGRNTPRELKAGDFVRMVKHWGDLFYYDANSKPTRILLRHSHGAGVPAAGPDFFYYDAMAMPVADGSMFYPQMGGYGYPAMPIAYGADAHPYGVPFDA